MTPPLSTFTITPDQAGQRLDIFCATNFPAISRSALQKAIKQSHITINGQSAKPKTTLKSHDTVQVNLPTPAQQVSDTPPPNLPILHEDPHVVVIDKPAGIVSHPGQGVASGTVTDWFAARYPDKVPALDPERPGLVHRLDKDTSGVLIMAKTPDAYDKLKRQFKLHRARKEYLALVFGNPGEPKGRITRPLARSKRNPLRRTIDPAGKPAITEWVKEETINNYTLLRVYPLTGRTHQIRAHLHFLGFPIVGDSLYVFKRQKSPAGVTRHLLHAEKLSLTLPSGKTKTFVAPLPDDFQQVLTSLRPSS